MLYLFATEIVPHSFKLFSVGRNAVLKLDCCVFLLYFLSVKGEKLVIGK